MKWNICFVLGAAVFLASFSWSTVTGAAPAGHEDFAPLTKSILKSADEAQKKQDLSPLQDIVGAKLDEWFQPGVCIAFQKSFMKNELKGWDPPTGGTQDPVLLLKMAFEGLKEAPVVTLKGRDFNPYKPDACGDDAEAKKKEWYNKWIVFPGDYLRDKNLLCEGGNAPATQAVERTLLYFKQGGDNVYFGLKKINGQWRIISVATNADCDA